MITTVDGVLAGAQQPREIIKAATGVLVAGRPHSLLYTAGIPALGAAPAPGIGGAPLTTYPGQIPFTNPVAGNSYLARLQAQATQAGSLLLCDRLWHNSGIDETLTTEQVFTASAQIPARDQDGTNAGTGVFAAVEVSTLTGAGVPTLTLKYTDQGGTAGQIATNVLPTVAASIAGSFYPIGLAAGDTGIRKAESLQLSATWTSGEIHVVLYRVIARLELTAVHIPNALDYLTSGFPRLYDNTVPFLVFIPNTTTATNVSGHVAWTQG